ncbi:Mpp10 protein [Tothia fuscella]|uniref:U3 small nucleolar ribonucleoprotein protein MPP10 n=1 Tax=Tothia fuscella TaxID=1048955 RepID=A0A9P4TZX5_9PEZI|nr:Mpp10 protein [Tothia fuscella]
MAVTTAISPPISLSSHTLSANSMANDALSTALNTLFPILQPSLDIHNAALHQAKRYLDSLAEEVSNAQNDRLKESRKKRKRGHYEEEIQPLQLKKIHVEGFKVDQVFEQVRRVLDATVVEVERFLPEILEKDGKGKGVIREVNGMSVEEEESISGSEEELGADSAGSQADGSEDSQEMTVSDIEDIQEAEESEEDIEEADDDDIQDALSEDSNAGEFAPDPHGLNDGFFSIDDFNKQSEFLEQQDTRGDPDDGAASDEEEIDWDADPVLLPPAGPSEAKNRATEPQDDDLSSEEEDDGAGGPTFGNMDLDAPEGASDDENNDKDEDMEFDDIDDISNTNTIYYKDFFAPPPKPAGKRAGRHGPPMKHNFPAKNPDETAEEDITRAMSAVHRDLFSDDEEEVENNNSGDALSDLDPSDPKSRRSTHERRHAKLLTEIRKLEAENVAKRSWILSGEARAIDRPLNSLLEEDLDFERGGKPVPVITQEITEEIEDLIKRRILSQEFNEILRRRPDELLTGAMARRGRVQDELADTKSAKGLAEIYEEEHLKKNDPNYVDTRTEKLKREHKEIEALWRDVSSKLDSLSSWHYRPKPVEMNVQVRSDAPVVSMEDARPSGLGGEVSTTTQLAPQEVYKAGEGKEGDEVVTKGGSVVKRDELSREQKLRRRRREKERARKAGENGQSQTTAGESKKGKERKEMVKDLKKGGVLVIGRKGEIRDVEGNEAKKGRPMTAGSLKL